MHRISAKLEIAQWRPWTRIGLILSVPIAVIAAAALAAADSSPKPEHREFARLAARSELLLRHWRALEADSEFKAVIDVMSQETFPSLKADEWHVKVVKLPVSDSTELNDFERGAIRQIEAGEDEIWSSSKRRGVQFVGAVRLSESCLSCHPGVVGQPENRFNLGDLIAYVSLQRGAPRNEK